MLHLQSLLQDAWLLIKAASLKLDADLSALSFDTGLAGSSADRESLFPLKLLQFT